MTTVSVTIGAVRNCKHNSPYVRMSVVGRGSEKPVRTAEGLTYNASFAFAGLALEDMIDVELRAKKFISSETIGRITLATRDLLDKARASTELQWFKLDTGAELSLSFSVIGAVMDGPSLAQNTTAFLAAPEAVVTAGTMAPAAAAPAATSTAGYSTSHFTTSPSVYINTDWRYASKDGSIPRNDTLAMRPNSMRMYQPGISHPQRVNRFVAGQVLEYVVELVIGECMAVCRGIYITMKGVAKGKLANVRTLSTRTKEDMLLAHSNLLKPQLVGAGADRVHLGKGKHLFPVKIQLPASLPTSFEVRGRDSAIRYSLFVEVDLVNQTDMTEKRYITIVNPEDLSVSVSDEGNQERTVSKSPMGAGGPVEMTVSMAKSGASMDEDLEVNCQIRNSSNRTIKDVTCELRRYVYVNGIAEDMNGDGIHEWDLKLHPRLVSGASTTTRLVCELDQMSVAGACTPISYKRGKYEAMYKLRVRVNMPNARDIYTDLPVRICAQNPKRPLPAWKEQPTLKQLAARLPAHPRDWTPRDVQAWIEEHVGLGDVLLPTFQLLELEGIDLLGLRPDAYTTIAVTAGQGPDVAEALRVAVDNLLDKHLRPIRILEILGLADYAPEFASARIQAEDLRYLHMGDLRSMMPLGPARKVFEYLRSHIPDFEGHFSCYDCRMLARSGKVDASEADEGKTDV